ncbi:MAG TPA: Rieske 2Fe-2S domain-containing protein [bacterium]|jgi:nitrite reductase/ring-hydroxylating ferredoxin subunit/alkylhydroperoxidase/carboxymuconolactone decarboxylase family protein YurZ
MSKSLDYLIQTRPEAMTAYFDFLKKSATHLDKKTAALISVITKIAVQTEGGLRQYLPRALREGATADEVIDAILFAFPALGLAKIVWAFDIILDMEIPEFQPVMLGTKPAWHDVVAGGDVASGATVRTEADGRKLLVHRNGDGFLVFDSHCPHQSTDIPLELDGNTLTCPKHHWEFDICTGKCIKVGKRPLKQFENKVENGRLLVYW